ncbi:MAG TPA: F0F1 ATP synthase subunit A [Terriglobia bacterium]|jgi:F-type H+-transporting ATPase subunit a|nr:F0F1 ATP synthase subunit A [Terriglobia bacterium]
MTPEHQVWFTLLLNKLIGGPVAALLMKMGFHPDPAQPIPNYVAMQILVVLLILAGALILRRRLSVENPGKFQHIMEVFLQFTENMCDDVIGHDGGRYVALIGTLGLFVALCNLLGIFPSFATATGTIYVTLGCAVVAFLYYNYHGIRQHGILGYLKHLSGPLWWLAFLILPVEVVSNTLRLLSLSVRLWANMMVGELIEHVFTSLVPLLVPAIFVGLHVFVSFLQAYIFMILPAVYISLAVSEEH